MKRRILSAMLALCMVIVLLPVGVAASTVASGSCGSNIRWSLDSNGTLKLSGTGDMSDFHMNFGYVLSPWWEYTGDVTKVTIGSGITSIGEAAFANCYNITSVSIPKTVKKIGKQAFYKCHDLTNITLPAGVSSIGESAFYETGLTEIALPDALTEIGAYAFYETELSSIVVPAGVTKAAAHVFESCNELTSVTFKGALTSIGEAAFRSCDLLSSIIFEGGTSGSIGDRAFGNCESLTSFDIPAGVTSIGESAFFQCRALTSVTIPEGVRSIGSSAFRETALVSVTIPSTVTYIGGSIFPFCYELKNVTMYTAAVEGIHGYLGGEDQLEYIHVIGDAPNAVNNAFGSVEEDFIVYYDEGTSGWNPPTWQDYVIEVWGKEDISKTGICGDDLTWTLRDGTLTISGTGSMYDYSHKESPWYIYKHRITDVVIEDGVTTIGDYAFADVETMEGISIAGSVTAIGSYAFWNCDGLQELVIPEGVTTVESSAFRGCTGLLKATMADSITAIGGSVFAECSSLASVKLPSDLTVIPQNFFYCCSSLTDVIIPESVTIIEVDAFAGCSSLAQITIPDSVTRIGRSAFQGCRSLARITIPNGVTKIESSAYQNCTSLTQVTIPDSVTSIDSSAFENCTSLSQITIPNSVTSIDRYAFKSCTGLSQITLSEGITWIADEVFYNCSSLSQIDLPSGVTGIGREAFRATGLQEIVIPENVKSIGIYAFFECEHLEQLYFKGDAPDFAHNSFLYVTATGFHPADNATWTEDVMQDYGGDIVWVPDDHMHSHEAVVTLPTCTEQGYTTYSCPVCRDTYTVGYVDALGHDLSEATCMAPKTCQRENCDYTEGDVLHVWSDPDALIKTCTVCGITDGGYRITLENTALDGATSVWIDGAEYAVTIDGSVSYVDLEHTDATNLVVYTYNDHNATDVHTQYPTGMKVWVLSCEGGAYTATYVQAFDNLLQYSGSSIRITGTKGIRMITSITKSNKQALTGKGLAGYKLVEYGTALAWASDLGGSNPLVLGQSYTKSNYAYKKGVADPVFKTTADLVQYTNVLVGFTDDQCIPDIAMRPYIIVEDSAGTQITIYGGIIYRSIGYIAYQNRNAFQPGTNSYNYVWGIIHHVYGDQYDAEYKG